MTIEEKMHEATKWLDDKLYFVFGPPPVGPGYEDDQLSQLWHDHGQDACPVCGQPLAEHDQQRDAEHGSVLLHCPGAPAGQGLETGREV